MCTSALFRPPPSAETDVLDNVAYAKAYNSDHQMTLLEQVRASLAIVHARFVCVPCHTVCSSPFGRCGRGDFTYKFSSCLCLQSRAACCVGSKITVPPPPLVAAVAVGVRHDVRVALLSHRGGLRHRSVPHGLHGARGAREPAAETGAVPAAAAAHGRRVRLRCGHHEPSRGETRCDVVRPAGASVQWDAPADCCSRCLCVTVYARVSACMQAVKPLSRCDTLYFLCVSYSTRRTLYFLVCFVRYSTNTVFPCVFRTLLDEHCISLCVFVLYSTTRSWYRSGATSSPTPARRACTSERVAEKTEFARCARVCVFVSRVRRLRGYVNLLLRKLAMYSGLLIISTLHCVFEARE